MASSVRRQPVFYALASGALVVASLYWARVVLIPVALAVLFTFLLNPVVAALQRLRLGRIPAVLVVVVLAGALLGGIGLTVMLQLTSFANELPRYTDNLKQKIADLRWVSQGGLVEKVQTTVQEVLDELQREAPRQLGEPRAPEPDKPVPVVVEGPSVLWQLPSLLEPLATAGLVIVLVIFMLLRHDDLRDRLIRLSGHGRLTTATKALDEAGHRISRYLLMQSIINGSFGGAVALGLFLIGVPYAVLLGFLAAVLRFIPYVGPAMGSVLPIGLSLVVFEGWLSPLLVAGLIVVLELISNMIMEPLLYGHSAGVSEVALLVAISFWTWLWGPVGLLLATPMTVCLGVLAKHVPQLEFLGVLLGDTPAMEPSTSYYQRLVAHDQDEAEEVVDAYLETNPVETVYDAVLVPALIATRRDREAGTLTEEDVQFIIQATRDIVDELGTRQTEASTPTAEVSETQNKASDATASTPILGCPARDELDELALLMLQQLLDPRQYEVEVLDADLLTAEVVSLVEQRNPRLVCIGALPPGGLAQTRYLCKRLRAKSPHLNIVVGRWGDPVEGEARRQLLQSLKVEHLATTLLESRTQIMHLSPLSPSPVSETGARMAPGEGNPASLSPAGAARDG